jgi:cellulose synthase/poly-beta-1,6-N-acetylglucosamine synthase-like glycosyltransferase
MLTATVLIPAHNEGPAIAETVRACFDQPYPVEQVIVVADSCTDDTVEHARRAGAAVIETEFRDKASNQNAALPLINTDAVVGFDGDTLPTPDCIQLMMADLEAGFDATCATILPRQERGFLIRARRFSYAMGRRWWRLCQAKVGRMQVLTGAAYAFRTEAIRNVGGFPNGLISADMDATWALHKDGYKVGYTPKAVALTQDPVTFREYRDQMRRWAAGYFQTMAKYRRQLVSWRSLLVVGTALFDLVSLFAFYGLLAFWLITGTGAPLVAGWVAWLGVHMVVNLTLVATVVGLRQAAMGLVPWLVMNTYNRWLYIAAMFREWVLGKHWASWTGRHGYAKQITPMSRRRKAVFTLGVSLLFVRGKHRRERGRYRLEGARA